MFLWIDFSVDWDLLDFFCRFFLKCLGFCRSICPSIKTSSAEKRVWVLTNYERYIWSSACQRKKPAIPIFAFFLETRVVICLKIIVFYHLFY